MALNEQSTGLGGIISVVIILASDVTDDDPDNFTYSNGQDLYFTSDTCDFKERDVNANNGTTVNYTLTFDIAQDREEIKEWIEQRREEDFIVLYKDANSKFKRVGSKEYSLELLTGLETKSTMTSLNRTRFQFSGSNFEKSPFIDSF